VAIARQIGEALAAAHDRGIIHRDLKPANVMLTRDGRVKVLDFGLAKMLEREPAASSVSMSPTLSLQATLAGTILGSAAYMSPEQARGRPVDKRTDVWAFGCVLFEMLAGQRAFVGEDSTETIAAVVRGEPAWTALPADLPRHLRSVIGGCLAKDPKQRYADIAVPLFLLVGTGTEAAPPPSVAGREPLPLWRRALPLAIVGVLAAAVAGVVAWGLKPSPPAPTVTRFTVQLPDGQSFSNPGRLSVALSPDGSNLVLATNQRLFVRSMSTLESHVIPGSEHGAQVTNPAVSPDGQEVAFYSRIDSSLKRLAINGGAPVTILATDEPSALSWAEDGIVFVQPAGILRVSPAGGTPDALVTITADERVSSPHMLPGGKALLFSLKKREDTWDEAQIVVRRLGESSNKTLVTGGADGRYVPTGHLVYARSGVLLAVPFDLDRLEVTGGAVPVVEGVRRTGGTGTGGVGLAQFSFAANGSLAYLPGRANVSATGDSDLALFDGKGGLETLKLPLGSYQSPRVSRDGRFVAFDANDENGGANISIHEIAGGSAPRRLTFGGVNRTPVWSPDGQWIAFQSDREKSMAIFRQRADGTGAAEQLTRPEAGPVIHVPHSWSPDGAYLLFSIQKGNEWALWSMSMKDRQATLFGDVRSLTSPEAVFSPDGRWVVYQTFDSDGVFLTQVFVQPFPATGAKFLVPQLGGHPYWSAKGDALILNTGAGQSRIVTFTTTPQVGFGRPVELSRAGRSENNPRTSRRNVDAMPDGRSIGVTIAGAESGDGTGRIAVVLNWFKELEARLAPK
jgi:serine/threonine-protein kinase